MRVIYVTPPYHGHCSVLLPLWRKNPNAHLVVVRFQDDPALENVGRERITIITALRGRPSEVAEVFNANRSDQLENVLRCFLHDLNPDQVVYDFFCLEAREACRHLGIPAVCSIPAQLKETETATCSDAILPKEHLYWLWKHPYTVAIEPVVFLGPRRDQDGIVVDQAKRTDEIWVTFGTVVPRYEGCRDRLNSFLKDLCQYAEQHRDQRIVLFNLAEEWDRFAHVLSVTVFGYVDLMKKFSECIPRTLIFHGGGNTFTEACHFRVSNMLVVPFFGDQFEVARRAGNQYCGHLAHDLNRLVPMKYPETESPLGHPFQDTFRDFFKPGDLVFGQRLNRDGLQANFPDLNLHLNHYKPFPEIASPETGDLPAIADVYNDSYHLADGNRETDEFSRRLSQYREVRDLARRRHERLPEDHRLVYGCLELLELTVLKWGGKIHFVLGAEPGPATEIELAHIRKRWDVLRDGVLFYDTSGRRVHAPFFMTNRKERSPDQVMGIGGGRPKGKGSARSKQVDRNLPLVDKYASRFGYVSHFDPPAGFETHVATCDLRVHYYYKQWVEMQFWPWIYFHNYQEDVKRGNPNHSDRDRQRRAQDILEGLSE